MVGVGLGWHHPTGESIDHRGSVVRITVSDPARLRQLSLFLSFDPDAEVSVTGSDELEVWFVGSRNAWAQVAETEMRLRRWLAWNPDTVASLLP
jgi:hypothetical protein